MQRRQPVFQAVEPQIVSSGLQPDRHLMQRPLWERAKNVSFYSGKVRRLPPPAKAFDVPGAGAIRGLMQVQHSNGIRWIYVARFQGNGELAVYRWFGTGATLIASFAATGLAENETLSRKATFVDLVSYGDWTIINVGPDRPPLLHTNAAGVGTTYNEAPHAQQFILRGPQVIAIGVGLERKSIAWSDGNDIHAWEQPVPTEEVPDPPANLSGTQGLMELRTGLVGASHLGPLISAYAEDQMVLMQFVGLPSVFISRVALDGIGLIGKMAVASDGRVNYGVGRNGIWRTDGQSYQYIDDPALKDYLQEEVNWAQGSKITAARNDVTGTIDFHFPMRQATDVNEGWRFDPRTGGWGTIPPYQIQIERSLFKKPLVGGAGAVFLLDDDPTKLDPTGLYKLDLATRPLVIAGSHSGVLIDEVDFLVHKVKGVEFRIGVSERFNGTVDWTKWETLHGDLRTHQIANRVSGTFVWLEFKSVIHDWEFDLQGFLLYGNVEGGKRDRH